MPGFDGTGPRGTGAMTGRGQGYCAVAYPKNGQPYGFVGLQGRPVGRLGLRRWWNPFRAFGRGLWSLGRGRRARRW